MQAPRWAHDPALGNGDTYGDSGLMRAYGLSVHVLTGRAAGDGDALFGAGSEQWRGHIGQAYGLLSGLWWNTRDRRTVVYVINGTPADPPPGRRSALTLWEEEVISAAMNR
jgi:hypothetical protein